MKALSVFLVTLLFTNLLRAQEPALRVSVVTGDGARQVINQKFRIEPVVEVVDEHGKPVEGAEVVFSLPSKGPGGLFDNGSKSLTVSTDAQGHATAHGVRVNRLKGPFQIGVAASFQGRTANAAIAQVSVTRAHKSGAFGVSTKTWVIVTLSALAIAGAIIAAKQFKSGPNPNVLTATPGIPTVGGPK
jgi:hypothetical protein